MDKDYYKILGVPKDASAEQIKDAFRALAMKYHPDRNKEKNSEEKFKEINEAYAVLSDKEKRSQYDAYGPDAFNQKYTQEDIFRNFNIEDVLKQMGFQFGFGGQDPFNIFGFSQGGSRRVDLGSDILARTDVTLREAATGVEKKIFVNHVKMCEQCDGQGGTGTVKCKRCGGAGQVGSTRRTPFGVMQMVSTCPECGGRGKSVEKVCKACGGHGRVRKEDKIDFKIPRGVDTGTRLRVKGMGDFGEDRAGDLYVDVKVLKDKTFERQGNDLIAELHVPFYVAAIGGKASAETLDGNVKVEIEPGTQTGAKIFLKNKGMPKLNREDYGDEIVKIIVDTPKSLNSEQKALLERFGELDSGKKPEGKKRLFGL